MSGDDFKALIEGLRARFGTNAQIAAAVGMTESGFSRGAKSGTFDVENCLQIARVSEAHPSHVLRISGKGKLADLIEELYGPGTDALTTSQREVVELWNDIAEERRAGLLFTMRVYAGVDGGDEARTRPIHEGSTSKPSKRLATRREERRNQQGSAEARKNG